MTKINQLISPEQVEKIVFDVYQIQGTAYALPGEIDLNFRIHTTGQTGFIFKIFHPKNAEERIDFTQKLLEQLHKNSEKSVLPKIIPKKNNAVTSVLTAVFGEERETQLITWIPGRLWSEVNPKLENLYHSLGEKCGDLTKALQGFDHPLAHSDFVWDIAKSLWTKGFLHLFSAEEKELITYFQKKFENRIPSYTELRKSVVHHDANDNNILVGHELINPPVIAIIDFGDTIRTQIINDVAIACAYAIMKTNDPLEAALPLVKGYHATFALEEAELVHLYNAIAMRLVISVTKSAMNKISEPNNTYLSISEKPAWELLKKWKDISEDFAHFSFRKTCGFRAHPKEENFTNVIKAQKLEISNLFPSLQKNTVFPLDLSVSSTWIGHQEEFNDLELFAYKIAKLEKEHPDKIIAGGYLEARPIYTASAYDKIGNNGRESRTIHLGVDFWLPAQTPVHAFFDGEIVVAENCAGHKDYGGLIILKHVLHGMEFFSLYGHLTVKSATAKKLGQRIKKGDCIAFLGDRHENGNWVPHLHFQVMLSLLDYKTDFPGVAFHKEIEVWRSICPDPNTLFKNKDLKTKESISNEELIAYRKEHLGKSLSLQYEIPIQMVRGAGQYLMDQFGRKYLDTLNNVAHVGHEHYTVVKAGLGQMALLNTNSRYLHENLQELAKELLETLPPELSVIHFVNSGSEANELAIRMVQEATGEKDIIASEVGYHGNTNACISISSYKFDGKGGKGAPEHTHIFPLPDAFRGKYRGENTGEKYAAEVHNCIKNIQNKGRNVGGLIVEPIISCGGQIELPEGFLRQAYHFVREAGGICISDEVQTGCGRMGKTFWGFQLHDVIPDIVTIGKPLGNGHPLAAVACTIEVAKKFANGMEYFNTFGGNPVSCAIGAEVLRVVKREKLQENALVIGAFLKSELQKLAEEFPIIGDVRGEGLFLGIELVDMHKNPLAAQTDYLANRMKTFGILMSTDGPDHNVLKIKPPIIFTRENAIELIFYLRKIFEEDFMKIQN